MKISNIFFILLLFQTFFVLGFASANRAPEVAIPVHDSALEVGHSESLLLGSWFSDPDGDTLTYSASSSDTSVVSLQSSSASATITAIAAGTAAYP